MTNGRTVIYTRISRDKEGEALGVERQQQDCTQLADRLGLMVSEVFTDNDISASTRSKKMRPEFERMLTLADAGEVHTILAYSNSRLTRRPKEWERLITLAEQSGVEFRTVVSGDANLATADGRAVARTIAAWDAAEAERTGERVQRKVRERAESGQFHGGQPPYGYDLGGPDDRGVVRSLVLNPEQAVVVRRIYEWIRDGRTLYFVAQTLRAEGITTRRGRFFGPQVIRSLMLSPTLKGYREHREWERRGKKRVLKSATLHRAAWDPILSEDEWQEVHDILTAPERDFAKGLRGVYGGKRVFSGGMAVCGSCGQKLVSAPNCRHKPDANGKRPCDLDADLRESEVRLVCKTNAAGGCGKVGVNNRDLEDFILDLVWERLDRPKWRAEMRRPVERAHDREDILRAELRQLDSRLTRVREGHEAGIYTTADAGRRIKAITSEAKAKQRELDGLQTDDPLAGIDNSEDGRAFWSRASVLARRRFLSRLIGSITIEEWPRDADGRKLPTTLTHRTATRRGYEPETVEQFQTRKREHERRVMRLRIPPQNIEWLA